MDMKTKKAVADKIEAIRKHNGGSLQPSHVVAEAKSEKSVLHQFFEWDDRVAGHRYRLDQARTLIRTIHVEVVIDSQEVSIPRYVRDPRVDSSEEGYATVAEIKDDKLLALESLKQEFQRAIALFERAVSIAEALGLDGRVTDLLDQLHRLQSTVERKRRSREKATAA